MNYKKKWYNKCRSLPKPLTAQNHTYIMNYEKIKGLNGSICYAPKIDVPNKNKLDFRHQ